MGLELDVFLQGGVLAWTFRDTIMDIVTCVAASHREGPHQRIISKHWLMSCFCWLLGCLWQEASASQLSSVMPSVRSLSGIKDRANIWLSPPPRWGGPWDSVPRMEWRFPWIWLLVLSLTAATVGGPGGVRERWPMLHVVWGARLRGDHLPSLGICRLRPAGPPIFSHPSPSPDSLDLSPAFFLSLYPFSSLSPPLLSLPSMAEGPGYPVLAAAAAGGAGTSHSES